MARQMKKFLSIIVWLDSVLFAAAFAVPAWCIWLSNYFINRSTHGGEPVPEGALAMLEKAGIFFSQAVAPLLFLFLLLCLFFHCSRWSHYVCHAYFAVAAGFLLVFLALWIPVVRLPLLARHITLSSILFQMARGGGGFQIIVLSGPACSLVFFFKELYMQKRSASTYRQETRVADENPKRGVCFMSPFDFTIAFLSIFIFPLSLVYLVKRAHKDLPLLWPGIGLLFCSFAWWRCLIGLL